MMAKWLIFISASILLASCSSQMHTADLSPDAVKVDGIPFRQVQQFKITLYKRDGGKFTEVPWKFVPAAKSDGVEENSAPIISLADPDRLSVMRYQGMPLADLTADVKLNVDGTLSHVGIVDSSRLDEAVKAGGDQLNAVAALRAAQAAADEAEEAAREKEVTGQADAELAYQNALYAYEQAKLKMQNAVEGSNEWQLAQLDLIKAQIEANDKAKRAGLEPPFPNASF